MGNTSAILLSGLRNLYDRNRLTFTFLFVIGFMAVVDLIFFLWVPHHHLHEFDPIFALSNKTLLSFAQEVWLGLLALVLGTLIIVISIASQSTPKLIDLYIDDEISLIYIWFLTIGCVQSFTFQLYSLNDDIEKQGGIFLNSYFLLPLCFLFAIPYILYILRYTKTSNVIDNIYETNAKLIDRAANPNIRPIFNRPKTISTYQFRMFEALNQLDDLLEYVTFREPKGDIIHKLGRSVTHFIEHKDYMHPNFFKISGKVREDISFKTMVQQFDDMEKNRTFYEQKAFRLLGNAYIRLIEGGDFDLASLVAHEIAECGRAAVESNDEKVIDTVIVRFNTLLRFGIKHGLRNNEPRNLYNAAFHYSEFLRVLIAHEKYDYVKKVCGYLKMYGFEIARHAANAGSFIFLLDVFTLEIKKALLAMHEKQQPLEIQEHVLGLLLDMDNTSEKTKGNINKAREKNNGVRVLQIALCLYYIRHQEFELADKIVEDIADDLEAFGEEFLREVVNAVCFRIKVSGDTFWEDTDRGNTNLYYSPEREYIPQFQARFENILQAKMKQVSSE